MTERLASSIVRIFTANEVTVGSGFLVAQKHLLTCAHVVAPALDIPQDTVKTPSEKVYLDFPLVGGGRRFTARVIFWQPLSSEPLALEKGGSDVAVLELENAPPDGVESVQLVRAENLWGHSFRVFGFPSGHDGGVWASGLLRGRQANGWVQIEDVKETGYRVEPGFSGAPVWDETLNGVVGMAAMAERQRPDAKAAFIIPADVLVRICSDLNILPRQTMQAIALEQRSSQKGATLKRIFISYKHNVDPDETIALEVFQALSQDYDVFIDQVMVIGTPWAERIKAEIRQADFLIAFLSARSIHSEMVEAEIEMAHNLAQQAGRPAILPVRLDYREPFQYPLSAYLNGIQWAFWQGQEDTERLIQELRQALAGSDLSISTKQSKAELIQTGELPAIPLPLPSAQPLSLEMPEGTMDLESKFYVQRPSDAIALNAIQRKGVTITIKGPRQMGKSSLLMRTIDAAIKADKRVAFLDFQQFNRTDLANPDLFFRQFCAWLTEQLEMANRVEEYWSDDVGNNQRCTRYMQRYLLKELGSPLLLAIDEVDFIFDTDFRSDFFSMLRSWHNSRAMPTIPIWKRLDLALVISTEPYYLIENLNQSPFNVGEVIELTDFTYEQVADLNQRHGSPLGRDVALQRLYKLLAGHPYLVRRVLYLIASQRISVDELFAKGTEDRGPFGEHLRSLLFRISDEEELVQGLLQVIRNNTCQDERVVRLLRAAGLVRREERAVLPRCQLYADYFREHLRG